MPTGQTDRTGQANGNLVDKPLILLPGSKVTCLRQSIPAKRTLAHCSIALLTCSLQVPSGFSPFPPFPPCGGLSLAPAPQANSHSQSSISSLRRPILYGGWWSWPIYVRPQSIWLLTASSAAKGVCLLYGMPFVWLNSLNPCR